MKFFPTFRIILCLILLFQPLVAFETDQYNLPPAPLADIGPEFSEYVEQNLQKAVEKVNAEISERKFCLENRKNARNSGCESAKGELAKLEYLQSDEAVAKELYELLGTGIPPLTQAERWLESYNFSSAPARYKTSFGNSIYSTNPANFLTLSSTVKMYGSQFGADKIAHFFQQGYSYFKLYKKALRAGSTREAAYKKAVKWGQLTENTYYGFLVSGVYSNADLAANYIGLKFYEGLAREIFVGSNKRLPVLLLDNGFWKINDEVDLSEILLKPFLSDHLNEALNPSVYTPFLGLRSFVHHVVKEKSCPQWREQFPNLSQEDLKEITEKLKFWNGEDYGFKESRAFITISNTCFETNL